MPIFNIQDYLDSVGAQITDTNDDGTVSIENPETGETGVFNPIEYLKTVPEAAKQMDKMQIEVNNPDRPLDKNGVGFSAGVKLALAKSPQDRRRILEEEYGPDNVSIDAEGAPVVKQGGTWKKADSGFLAGIAAESGVSVGGIAGFAAGAKGGAALGTAIAPGLGTAAGAALGGILGGAAGATLARFGTIEAAEKLGIRSEADAESVKNELGQEFVNSLIWDSALFGTGKLVKAVAPQVKALAKRAYDLGTNKEAIAALAENLISGSKREDWRTIVRSTDDALAVKTDLDDVIAFKQKAANNQVLAGKGDPALNKTVRITTGFLKQAKARASESFEQGMNHLEKHGAFKNARLAVSDLKSSLEETLKGLGVLNESGQRVTTKGALQQGLDVQVFDSASRTRLAEIYERINNVNKKTEGANVSIPEARKLLKSFDEILENSGAFKNGDLAISDQSRRLLKETRNSLRTKIAQSLDNIEIPSLKDANQKVRASQIFNETNRTYHQFRDIFDDFAVVADGGRMQTFDTVQKMLGKNGMDLEQRFGALAKLTGQNGEKTLRRLQQLRAARNLSEIYSSQRGLGNVIKTLFIPQVSSPRAGAQFMVNQSMRINKPSVNTPVTRTTLNSLKKIGQASDFLRNMPVSQRLQLANNPELFTSFIRSIDAGNVREQEIESQLLGTGQ